MSDTWYRARWGEITPVEVERATEQFLVIGGRRTAKRTNDPDWENFFPTEAEAVEHVRAHLHGKVRAALAALDRAQIKLAAFDERYPGGTQI